MSQISPSTTTVKVIVRHGTKCKSTNPNLPADWKECHCRKSIYLYENGEDNVISARTRSWDEAERVAQAERDKRDPDKRKIRELEERLAEEQARQVEALSAKTSSTSIVEATQRC